MKKYVVYFRVSSKEQGKSGLGLEAQQTMVNEFLKRERATEIPPSYTEVESGKNNNRPELRKAVNRCKEIGATLLIAKLDRLSRNVAFIFTLKEELEAAKVGFIACDLPDANTLTLSLMAALAQQERELISQRTKAALQELKKRGAKLGKPENLTDAARLKARKSIISNARENVNIRHAFHYIQPLREKGMSYQKIAEQLNKEGYRTRKGKLFFAIQVSNIYKRFTENKI